MAFWNNTTTRQDRPAEASKPAWEPAPTAPVPVNTVRAKEEEIPMAMMKREESVQPPAGNGDLLLGQGAEFEGKLTFAGTVRIDAKFKGSIITDDVLVVGEHARIDAEIVCGTIIVYGEVNGNVRAKTAIELRHPAKLRGNIQTPSFMMEKGVLFQGESKMDSTEKSTRSVPTLAAAAPASGV